METRFVNCGKGRELGCRSYCCRLLVRLDPEERGEPKQGLPAPGFVGKDEDGLCVHFDCDSHQCSIWQQRPRVCREYTCNDDVLLQVAVRESFVSIVDLVKKAQHTYIPKDVYIRVPVDPEDVDQ